MLLVVQQGLGEPWSPLCFANITVVVGNYWVSKSWQVLYSHDTSHWSYTERNSKKVIPLEPICLVATLVDLSSAPVSPPSDTQDFRLASISKQYCGWYSCFSSWSILQPLAGCLPVLLDPEQFTGPQLDHRNQRKTSRKILNYDVENIYETWHSHPSKGLSSDIPRPHALSSNQATANGLRKVGPPYHLARC
jgi:hypothetical protein